MMIVLRKSWRMIAATMLLTAIQWTGMTSEQLADARAAVSQWVEVEKTISRESLAWEEKKQLLEDMIAVAKAEIAMMQDQLDEAKITTDQTEARRSELVKERDENAAQSEQIKTFLIGFEAKLKTLFPRLPKPLTDKLQALMERLPDDPENTPLGIAARMQAVIGVIAEIQQFDQTVTTGEELLTLSNGGTREIYTIHFGLGASYYMNTDKSEAGVGIADENGWRWEPKAELASRVEKAITLAKGNSMEAGFLSLPVTIQKTQR